MNDPDCPRRRKAKAKAKAKGREEKRESVTLIPNHSSNIPLAVLHL